MKITNLCNLIKFNFIKQGKEICLTEEVVNIWVVEKKDFTSVMRR